MLILPPPNPENREHLPSYARAVASLLELGGEAAVTRISIRLPVSDRPPPSSAASGHAVQAAYLAEMDKKHKRRSSMGVPGHRMSMASNGQHSAVGGARSLMHGGGADGSAFAWEMWDVIRSACGYHSRLSLGGQRVARKSLVP